MDAAELERIDRTLRRLCERQQLIWVLAAVDTAIHEGFSESVNAGSSSYHERGGSWRSFPGVQFDADSGKRPQPESRERPFTLQERAILLLDALLRVFRDLPQIRQSTIDTLNHGWDGRVPLPDRILFIDDDADGDAESGFSIGPEPAGDATRRQRVVRALVNLRTEVLA
jgi:hypothetical protein